MGLFSASSLELLPSRLILFDPFDQALHPLVMRTFPVDLSAGGADMKFVKVLFGQWFQAVEDHILVNRLQWMIAAQTAVEGLDFIHQLKALDDFG